MEVSAPYYKLVKYCESLHDGNLSIMGLQPKPCPSGVYTTGWGHAIVDPKTGKFVTTATKNGYKRACELFTDLTIEQADKLLEEDTINMLAGNKFDHHFVVQNTPFTYKLHQINDVECKKIAFPIFF